MSLEPRTQEQIAREFPEPLRGTVTSLLEAYQGPERERVVRDILLLGKGKLEALREYLAAAQRDYRDVIYWAEYYHNDPGVQGRDPKELVKDLLAKLRGTGSDGKA